MASRGLQDPVTSIGALIAEMSLRECAFLDALWSNRHPGPFGPRTKRRHKQFLNELIAYYTCVAEDFLECELPDSMERFMDLVTHEVVTGATSDSFLARPPYFQSDLVAIRRKRYLERIRSARAKLRLMPPHMKSDWLAARAAGELRWIMSDTSDDPNELARIETVFIERLQWTADELTGEWQIRR